MSTTDSAAASPRHGHPSPTHPDPVKNTFRMNVSKRPPINKHKNDRKVKSGSIILIDPKVDAGERLMPFKRVIKLTGSGRSD